MAMEDILDSLDDLGFMQSGSLESETIDLAIVNGAHSTEYTQLVEWLSKELQVLCSLEGYVNAVTSSDEYSSFLLEVSSFLKEMCCPYLILTEGDVNQRLATKTARLVLLDFLCAELQAARMFYVKKPKSQMTVEMLESETACDLKRMCITLGMGKPPDNIASVQLFSKIGSKVDEKMKVMPLSVLSKPLFLGVLTGNQWRILAKLQEQMHKEYTLRRETLLKRLDVTIQSFKWSDRLKVKADEIYKVYGPRRKLMAEEPSVHLADVFAAREDLAIIEKTSSMTVRKNTQSAVNKVLIGKVPDRGGRPEDQLPPPPEMPSWQKRSDPHGAGSHGGDRGGGRVQSGWSGGHDRGSRGGGRRGGGWSGRGKDSQYGQSVSYDAAGTYGQQNKHY